jgi:DNA-binding Xre family transcriptional regulator
MSKGEPITTNTINELCLILHCRPEDILTFEITTEEESFQKKREMQIAEKKKK